eukprot:7595383-Alexandrium_andersonii.AAC.1
MLQPIACKHPQTLRDRPDCGPPLARSTAARSAPERATAARHGPKTLRPCSEALAPQTYPHQDQSIAEACAPRNCTRMGKTTDAAPDLT